MYKHLMLPTDGSELSERAAREGVRFAKSFGAQLTVLHTTPLFYPSQLPAPARGREYAARARGHEESANENAARALGPIERMAREAGVVCSAVHRVTDSPWRTSSTWQWSVAAT